MPGATVLSKAVDRRAMSDAEWEARVTVAAAHRVAVYYKWDYLIYNHICMRVPGEDAFLIKPHPVRFKEVKASTLLKLPLDPKRIPLESGVQAAGFTIHTAVLNARPDINCTVHVHTRESVAMSARAEGLLPLDQGAMRFYGGRLSYHDFEGQADDLDEAGRIARDLGPKNKAMMLRNHGPLACGEDMGEAIGMMYFLIQACEIQLIAEAGGGKINIPSKKVCEHGAAQWDAHHRSLGQDEWPAYLRMMDEIDPSYKE